MWKSASWTVTVVIFTSQIVVGKSYNFPDARRYVSMPAIFHIDDFDRCMLYGQEALYCTLEVQLQPEHPENFSTTWKTIKEYSSSSSNYRHDLLRHGLCIPDTFPNSPPDVAGSLKDTTSLQDRLVNYYNEKYKHAGMKSEIVKMHCETQESFYPIEFYDILVGVILVGYVAFVIFASFYEVLSKGFGTANMENSHKGYISAFSIPNNWRRLVTVNWEDPDVKELRLIQGIRFYNMTLVISAHTFFSNLSGPISNNLYLETINNNVLFPLFANGGYAVQTYFMISTWLLTYYFFVKFGNAKEIKPKFFLLALVNRYLRLMPALAVIVAFQKTWMVRISRGPMWDMLVGEAYRNCRTTWWSNLLFINNYIGDGRMCMPETWYVCNEMQFFIVALFLLRYMWKNQKKIPMVLGSLLAVHVVVIFTMIYKNNWEFLVRPTPEGLYGEKLLQSAQWHSTMISIWANIPGFVAGIAYGYIYYKYKKSRFFDTPLKTVAWLISIWSIGLGIIMIPGTIQLGPDYKYNALHAAIYASTGRILFAFAIGIGILGMIQGSGRLMKMVCEWKFLYVLGRLTYSAYLTHVFIMRILVGSRRSPKYLSDLVMFADVAWITILTYILSLLLTLFVELPVSQLLKNFLPNDNKEKSSGKIPNRSTRSDNGAKSL